jgi:hypothetical protein
MDIGDKNLDIINNLKNKRDIEGLLELLKSTNVEVVSETACVLGEFKDSKIIGPLIKLLHHKDNDVRWCSANSLGKIGNKDAVEPLIEIIDDKENKVRESVVLALGELKDGRAFKPLIKALNDDDYSVKKSAITSLVELNDKRAYSHIEKKLINEDSSIARWAADALVEIDEKKSHKTLKNLIDLKIVNIDPENKDRNLLLKMFIILPFIVVVIFKIIYPFHLNIITHSNVYLEFFINFLLLFLFFFLIFILILLYIEFTSKDAVHVYGNGFLVYEDDFRKIFKKRLAKVYKIIKLKENTFQISIPDKRKKLKNVKIYFAGDIHAHENDFEIFIDKFKSLDDCHQKDLMKTIEESYLKYLLTPYTDLI